MSEFYSQYAGKILLIATTKENSKGYRNPSLLIKAAAAINPGEKNSPCDWKNQIISFIPDEVAAKWHNAIKFYLNTGNPTFLTQVDDKGFNVNDYMTDRSKSNSSKGKKYAKSSVYGYVDNNNVTKFYLYLSEWNSNSDKVEVRIPLDIARLNDVMTYIEGYLTVIRPYHVYLGYTEFNSNRNKSSNNGQSNNRNNNTPQNNSNFNGNQRNQGNGSFGNNVGGSPFNQTPQTQQNNNQQSEADVNQPNAHPSGFGQSTPNSVEQFLN